MKKRRSEDRCGASAERARLSLPPGGSCHRQQAVTEEECGRKSFGFEYYKTCSCPLDLAVPLPLRYGYWEERGMVRSEKAENSDYLYGTLRFLQREWNEDIRKTTDIHRRWSFFTFALSLHVRQSKKDHLVDEFVSADVCFRGLIIQYAKRFGRDSHGDHFFFWLSSYKNGHLAHHPLAYCIRK